MSDYLPGDNPGFASLEDEIIYSLSQFQPVKSIENDCELQPNTNVPQLSHNPEHSFGQSPSSITDSSYGFRTGNLSDNQDFDDLHLVHPTEIMPQNDKEWDAMLKTAEDMLALSSDSENITAQVSDNNDQMISSPADSGIFSPQCSPPISPVTPKASNPKSTKKVKAENIVHWVFHLLQERPDVITWDHYENGVFKIVDTNELERLWGEKKGNPKTTYDNFA